MKPRFALDQNFPTPIIQALRSSIVEVELAPVFAIDRRLSELDDWELLLALHHHPDRYDGLITTDSSMLSQARELAVLMQTRLTLVVAQAAGHDPVRATGLVLTHLPQIAKMTRPDKAQIWSLSARTPAADDPWVVLGTVASRAKTTARALYAAQKLDPATLARDPLASVPG